MSIGYNINQFVLCQIILPIEFGCCYMYVVLQSRRMPVSWEALCWDLPPEVLDYKCFKTSISSSLRSPSPFIVIECAIECVRFSRDSLTENFSLLCLLLFPLLLLSTFHILILLIIFAAKSNYSPLILYLSQNSPKRQWHFFLLIRNIK